jgi:DNA-binding response OmpR family regulator
MAKKVLIIEDSADISGSLKLLIEMEGYDAVIANSGLEGWRKAIDEKPDLILMDLSLPDLNGVDLTRQIRSHPGISEVPILCVSSYTRGREVELLEVGCSEVFSKTSFMISFGSILTKYLETAI